VDDGGGPVALPMGEQGAATRTPPESGRGLPSVVADTLGGPPGD
jgi:hypothetical protein